jgi:hypothetical protein
MSHNLSLSRCKEKGRFHSACSPQQALMLIHDMRLIIDFQQHKSIALKCRAWAENHSVWCILPLQLSLHLHNAIWNLMSIIYYSPRVCITTYITLNAKDARASIFQSILLLATYTLHISRRENRQKLRLPYCVSPGWCHGWQKVHIHKDKYNVWKVLWQQQWDGFADGERFFRL